MSSAKRDLLHGRLRRQPARVNQVAYLCEGVSRTIRGGARPQILKSKLMLVQLLLSLADDGATSESWYGTCPVF